MDWNKLSPVQLNVLFKHGQLDKDECDRINYNLYLGYVTNIKVCFMAVWFVHTTNNDNKFVIVG